MSTELTPAMRRSVLIAALRHPEDWPPGFEWHFYDCETCAIGLFRALMPDYPYPCDRDQDLAMAEALGISTTEACCTFIRASTYQKTHDNVTPDDVADRLERLHKELSA